jgi:hypothetical protein
LLGGTAEAVKCAEGYILLIRDLAPRPLELGAGQGYQALKVTLP